MSVLRPFAVMLLVSGALFVGATSLWSQDKAPSEPKESTKKEGAEPAAAEPKEETDVTGPAGKKFAATYESWKEVLKKLRALRTKYAAAEEGEKPNLQKDWDEQIAAADKLLAAMRVDGIAAYEEAPNLDTTVTRFLVKLLADEVGRDEYESAQQLADLLIKNNCEFKIIYNYAGIIAFVLNDFDSAEKYFKIAAESKSLNKVGEEYASLVTEYKDLWKKEKELREAEAKTDDLPRVKIETSKGPIVVELFENEAPQTVGNFVHLVESKFYDGTKFHRVLPGFMAQGGDPKGDGSGGAEWNIPCECEKPNHRQHFRGVLSMAHRGKDTGSSQFFLTFVPTAHLNDKHTVFGRVIEGFDVLAKIQRINPEDPKSIEIKPDIIVKAEVVRKRDHEYVPTKLK